MTMLVLAAGFGMPILLAWIITRRAAPFYGNPTADDLPAESHSGDDSESDR